MNRPLDKNPAPSPPACWSNPSGFTLIELAIVIVIVGIIISIVASVLPSLMASSKIGQARALLERADHTLQGYSIANYRIPYADSDGDGLEDAGVFSGTLPYRTIGLSSGTDVWGNSIRYAVYGVGGGAQNLTQPKSRFDPPSPEPGRHLPG